ncbi:mechanosensitive ion channel family protein [Algoriphagus halophytocola]|uniref:Mechanosensitive ion channel family protein n=1 Tax=Algoriphagus halophytocola TaxID=2991499 RepID=A0ABY6MFS1_9BACT|nr:mechanosensitive ion channel family protein [Algoriphagus sp. TR-M5]UZD22665.1 mechanosensitive ion channel family protein [Algoriphagus sp. TR-M5]
MYKPFLLLFFLMLSLPATQVSAQDTASDSLESVEYEASPVLFYEDTLFFIRTKFGPYSAEERAKNQSERLNLLTEDEAFDTAKINIIEDELSAEILHGDLVLASITTLDAKLLGKDKNELAQEYATAIKDSYVKNHGEKSLIKNLIRTGIILGILIVLLILVKYINKGFNSLINFILRKWRNYFRGIKIKNIEVLSAKKEERLLFVIMRILKVILIFTLIYLSLPIAFSIFPATKGLSSILLNYVISPLKSIGISFFGYIPEMIMILIACSIAYYLVKGINLISAEVANGNLSIPGFYPEWAKPTFNLVKMLVIAFTFIVIFPYLPGSDSPAFQGVSVFLGLLISLGSSSAISNIIAGLVIIYMRAFKLGDRVKIGETTGDVIEKTMLVTRLRTIKNEEVTIPNASILNGRTINYSAEANGPGLILHTTITIGYDVEWRQVHELLIGAALKTDMVLKEPKPFVLQTSLDDFYVSYQINAYTATPEKAAQIYSELHSLIQDAFNEAGVEIMSPHFRAARDGNPLAVPPSYLPEGYVPPSFKIKSSAENQEQKP